MRNKDNTDSNMVYKVGILKEKALQLLELQGFSYGGEGGI